MSFAQLRKKKNQQPRNVHKTQNQKTRINQENQYVLIASTTVHIVLRQLKKEILMKKLVLIGVSMRKTGRKHQRYTAKIRSGLKKKERKRSSKFKQ